MLCSGSVKPRVVKRECGGWLAVSPQDAPMHLGETGATQEEAVRRFQLAWKRWSETLDKPKEA